MHQSNNQPNFDYWRLRPFAPAQGTCLCQTADIAVNSAREFKFGRGKNSFSMFIVRTEAGFYGYLNLCPHFSLPLNYRAEEFLNASGSLIRCSMHFAEFRLEDGYCVSGAAEKCFLDPVPIYEEEEALYIGDKPPCP